jgi:hypothetical protein
MLASPYRILSVQKALNTEQAASASNPLTFLSTHAPQLSVGLLRFRFCPVGEAPSPSAAVGADRNPSSLPCVRKMDEPGGDGAAKGAAGGMLKFISGGVGSRERE